MKSLDVKVIYPKAKLNGHLAPNIVNERNLWASVLHTYIEDAGVAYPVLRQETDRRKYGFCEAGIKLHQEIITQEDRFQALYESAQSEWCKSICVAVDINHKDLIFKIKASRQSILNNINKGRNHV